MFRSSFDSDGTGQPRVRMPQQVWTRLWAYIRACPMEVGGLGTVDIIDGDVVISDIYLYRQKVRPDLTSLDTAAVRAFHLDWIAKGQDPERLKFWWHSHATFPVGWSPKDEKTIRALTERNMIVTFVGNHRGESRLRITTAGPERLVFDRLPLEIIPRLPADVAKAARAEVEAKVQMDDGPLMARWFRD